MSDIHSHAQQNSSTNSKKSLTKQDIIAVAKECFDPELDLDIWTLGLVYEIKIRENEPAPDRQTAYVRMTLTSPMCPFGRELTEQLKDGLYAKGFEQVKIDVVFDPPWTPSPEVREILGIG